MLSYIYQHMDLTSKFMPEPSTPILQEAPEVVEVLVEMYYGGFCGNYYMRKAHFASNPVESSGKLVSTGFTLSRERRWGPHGMSSGNLFLDYGEGIYRLVCWMASDCEERRTFQELCTLVSDDPSKNGLRYIVSLEIAETAGAWMLMLDSLDELSVPKW
jgi:hypothetical protein